jgi:hypothetical protein
VQGKKHPVLELKALLRFSHGQSAIKEIAE